MHYWSVSYSNVKSGVANGLYAGWVRLRRTVDNIFNNIAQGYTAVLFDTAAFDPMHPQFRASFDDRVVGSAELS